MSTFNCDTGNLEAYLRGLEDKLRGLHPSKGDAMARAMHAHLSQEIWKARNQIAKMAVPYLGKNRHHAEAGITCHTAKNGLYARIDTTTRRKSSAVASVAEDWAKYHGKHSRGMGKRTYRNGIMRKRTIKARTKKIRSYTGTDRQFILHILAAGRDVYLATGTPGRGGRGTYGMRGAIGKKADILGNFATRFDKIGTSHLEFAIDFANKILNS